MKETFYLLMLVVPRQAAKAVIRKQIEFAMQLRRLPTKLVSDRDVANYRAGSMVQILVKAFVPNCYRWLARGPASVVGAGYV